MSADLASGRQQMYATFTCALCGLPVDRGPAFCSQRCLQIAIRELRMNAEQHRRLSLANGIEGDYSDALYRLALRNGRLMAAIQSWRPDTDR